MLKIRERVRRLRAHDEYTPIGTMVYCIDATIRYVIGLTCMFLPVIVQKVAVYNGYNPLQWLDTLSIWIVIPVCLCLVLWSFAWLCITFVWAFSDSGHGPGYGL